MPETTYEDQETARRNDHLLRIYTALLIGAAAALLYTIGGVQSWVAIPILLGGLAYMIVTTVTYATRTTHQ